MQRDICVKTVCQDEIVHRCLQHYLHCRVAAGEKVRLPANDGRAVVVGTECYAAAGQDELSTTGDESSTKNKHAC